jgi:tetrapyrrole methylase family protein/MazG family protein
MPARDTVGARFEALVELQRRLLAPDGCPWDREQTHQTLRTFLLEETYEVLDALERADPARMADELGDLLLQIIFHAELARAAGQFDIARVIDRIHAKMVRRHPHVFGPEGAPRAADARTVLKNWEELKAEERALGNGRRSVLAGVPATLPALMEAYQLTRRAANIGFDWESVDGLLEKLREETAELRHAVAAPDTSGRARTEEEVGDLLFVVVNLARFLGLDPELALRRANRKFIARFEEMEQEMARRGSRLEDASREEMERLWERSKSVLRARG